MNKRGRPTLPGPCKTSTCRNKRQHFSDYCENCIISRKDFIENADEHPLSDALEVLTDSSLC